jgi:hypothetical protein
MDTLFRFESSIQCAKPVSSEVIARLLESLYDKGALDAHIFGMKPSDKEVTPGFILCGTFALKGSTEARKVSATIRKAVGAEIKTRPSPGVSWYPEENAEEIWTL